MGWLIGIGAEDGLAPPPPSALLTDRACPESPCQQNRAKAALGSGCGSSCKQIQNSSFAGSQRHAASRCRSSQCRDASSVEAANGMLQTRVQGGHILCHLARLHRARLGLQPEAAAPEALQAASRWRRAGRVTETGRQAGQCGRGREAGQCGRDREVGAVVCGRGREPGWPTGAIGYPGGGGAEIERQGSSWILLCMGGKLARLGQCARS
eukprot:349649-Chlamydomonas_euryale.AAC.1